MKTVHYILSFLLAVVLASCTTPLMEESHDDLKYYYKQYDVEGSFLLFDEAQNKKIYFNKKQLNEAFTPASTFKICNSLIGLETGVIKDENFIIPWDSVKRNPTWDQEHDMKKAFKNSTVWYYQELARRVGGKQMKYWLDKANYGNKDTSGGIDRFWLTGGLRITPEQQIQFLRDLHDNKLPFSQRSMDIVKDIMIIQDTLGYVIHAKTGWGMQGSKDIGWCVGYLESKDNVYYFSNCVQIESKKMEIGESFVRFELSRIRIIDYILSNLVEKNH